MPEDDVEIGGMTYDTYSADRDSSGAIGIALADARREEEQLERALSECDRADKVRKYRRFLDEHVDTNSGESMMSVLAKYFPGRFGEKGIQKLDRYSREKIYGVYRGLVNTAEKFVKSRKDN